MLPSFKIWLAFQFCPTCWTFSSEVGRISQLREEPISAQRSIERYCPFLVDSPSSGKGQLAWLNYSIPGTSNSFGFYPYSYKYIQYTLCPSWRHNGQPRSVSQCDSVCTGQKKNTNQNHHIQFNFFKKKKLDFICHFCFKKIFVWIVFYCFGSFHDDMFQRSWQKCDYCLYTGRTETLTQVVWQLKDKIVLDSKVPKVTI